MNYYRVKTKEELLATTPNYTRLFGGGFGKTLEDESLIFGKVSLRGMGTDYGDNWIGSLYNMDIHKDATVRITAEEYKELVAKLPLIELRTKAGSGRITVYRRQSVVFYVDLDPIGNPEFCSIQSFNQILSGSNLSANELIRLFKDYIIPVTGNKVFMFDVHDRYRSTIQAMGAIGLTPYVSSNSTRMIAGLLKF